MWKSARELALEPLRWEVTIRCERGYAELLPDLAGWNSHSVAPIALIAESGGRRDDRQKIILEGWRDAIVSGQYAAVRYDCASTSVAQWINRLAKKVRLTGSKFTAVLQPNAGEIAALPTADPEPDELPRPQQTPSAETAPPDDQQVQLAPVRAPLPPPPAPEKPPEPAPEPYRETPEAAAKRERAYREIFGIDEPERRRRWRR